MLINNIYIYSCIRVFIQVFVSLGQPCRIVCIMIIGVDFHASNVSYILDLVLKQIPCLFVPRLKLGKLPSCIVDEEDHKEKNDNEHSCDDD
jgi:hypothetical protein